MAGDYIVVLPFNHRDVMRRVLHRFDLHADDMIEIKETNKAFLVSTRMDSRRHLVSDF